MKFQTLLSTTLAVVGSVDALTNRRPPAHQNRGRSLKERDGVTYMQNVLPAPVKDYQTFKTPGGYTVRYREPGKDGVCETTPGVNSYSGYIDLGQKKHAWFFFFESRRDPANDPITLWLNGGPGSDSNIGLYQELGPCSITENLTSVINPYSWTNVSNFIFLSQPYGVGFSYEEEQVGSLNNVTGVYQGINDGPVTGRFPTTNPTDIDKTTEAAKAGWEIIQAFYSALPQLDSKVKSKEFNLWTESYGGHYGPGFFDYFQQQNDMIGQGKKKGYHLNMNSLGIGNGIIDFAIQGASYPDFAVNNTYGIKSINDTVYNYASFALNMPNGCLDQIDLCMQSGRKSFAAKAICAEAYAMCRDNVEGPYYVFSGRNAYDIRQPSDDPTPPDYFADYLNLPAVQQALGVDVNYTEANDQVYYGFQSTGDWIYSDLITKLQRILDSGVRVSLFYGDADYICNWFGGEAISLAVNYTHSAQFRAAGYTPLLVDGKEYGEVRQAGNFSFTRIYESGHEVPYYQPQAALAVFNRSIALVGIATGTKKITADLSTNGTAKATHTEPFVPLPTTSSA